MTEPRANKTQQAYETIRSRILDGDYVPAQRLIVRTLAEELEMSAVPIREALRRLEAEDWVVIRPNVGAEVRPVDATQWVAAMDALALVDGHATALAAPLLGAEDLARARQANGRMREALESMNTLAASQANQQFHAVFYEHCSNPYVRELVLAAGERVGAMLRTVFVFVPHRTAAAVGEHDQLLELVEAGADPEEIGVFARLHKLRTVAAYLTRDGEPLPDFATSAELVRQALVDNRAEATEATQRAV
jgi:DNA-binding GntR family transcriptional regulator